MLASPRLIRRSTRYVDLSIAHKPGVTGFRLSAANTLDQAHSSATAMFTVNQGASFRSKSIRRRRLGLEPGSNRGVTRVIYDPEDYWAAAGTLPHDSEFAYLRLEERLPDGSFKPSGPIFVLPPSLGNANFRPNLVLHGTAPSASATTTGKPPSTAMKVVLPAEVDSFTVKNVDGTNALFVAFSENGQEFKVDSGEEPTFFDAVVSAFYLRGDGGAVEFYIYSAVVNGVMG